MQLKALNKKKIKEILKLLESQFKFKGELDYIFYLSSKDKLYLINNDLKEHDISDFRVNSLGIYFGEIDHGEIRLSIEGSQLVGPEAKKNVLELNDKQAWRWIKGGDVLIEAENDFYLIKNNKDFLGCGRVKENKLINFVPKARRLNVSE